MRAGQAANQGPAMTAVSGGRDMRRKGISRKAETEMRQVQTRRQDEAGIRLARVWPTGYHTHRFPILARVVEKKSLRRSDHAACDVRSRR